MPAHTESRIVPYPAQHMFAIVADVERYPEFVPWCVDQQILKREKVGRRAILLCETVVGFRNLRERYRSRATIVESELRIDVEQVDGAFRRMQTHWRFTPVDEKSCRVDFAIDFEFKSRLLGAIAGSAFGLVVSQMTHAFEAQAKKLSNKPL